MSRCRWGVGAVLRLLARPDGLYEALTPGKRAQGLRKFWELGAIVAGFMAGAIAGAALAPRWLNHTLWFLEAPLGAVLGLVVWRGRR